MEISQLTQSMCQHRVAASLAAVREQIHSVDAGNDKATGGQGKTGSPRNGNSTADLGDVITAEVIDETFATLFAFE